MPHLRSFLSLGVIIAIGCSKPPESPSTKAPPGGNATPTIYVFSTSDNASRRLVFTLRNDELFVCDFPAKAKEATSHKKYLLKTLPADLKSMLLTWERKGQTARTGLASGQIKSNGPAILTRHEVYSGPEKAHSWSHFIDDKEVRELIETVRTIAIKPENEVESLPSWIEEDGRLKGDFAG